MYKTIYKLIQTEKGIANVYSLLSELEAKKEKDSNSFNIFLNTLQNKKKEEEELLNTLTIRELNYLTDEKKLSNLLKGFKTNYEIKKRIAKNVAYTLALKGLNESKDKIVIDAIISESIDIYLSFLDEEIENANHHDRKILVEEKYKYIYDLYLDDEKRLLDRKFYTDKSLYLYSKMYAEANRFNKEKYETIKDAISLNILHEASDQLSNNKYLIKPYNLIVLLKIRTHLLLLDNETYNTIIEKILSNDFDSVFLSDVFTDNFTSIVLEDQERHKVLSLRPNNPHE